MYFIPLGILLKDRILLPVEQPTKFEFVILHSGMTDSKLNSVRLIEGLRAATLCTFLFFLTYEESRKLFRINENKLNQSSLNHAESTMKNFACLLAQTLQQKSVKDRRV